ncbi:MAG: hypothetical protein ABIN97_15560 [Ginsengibacter sp.]
MRTKSESNKRVLPLTSRMIEILMDCHERELMNVEPCHSTNTKYIKGLIERGMVTTKLSVNGNGKPIVTFCVTNVARSYLNKL